MKDKFLIGELAKLFNISTDALRHYDKIELLKPHFDNKNSYRYYSIRDFFKLSRILFLKNLDISLEEIKKYMSNKNVENLVNLLKKKEEEVDIKMNKLINLKKKIQTKIEGFESFKGELDQVKIKTIPERVGVFLDIEEVENDAHIKQVFKSSEKYLKISSWLIEGQVYTSLSKTNMENEIYEKFTYFIEIVSIEEDLNEQLQIIPKHDYACITFLGPYRDIEKHYRVLINWIKENGYEITGNSIEKNIVDYDFSDSENEYVSEIQIPIERKKII